MEIRTAAEDDRSLVFALAQRFATSFNVERPAFDTSYSQLLSQDDARLVVAAQHGQVVGYCLAFDHPAFFANGRVTWVVEIMVSEETRRSGVGRKLMSSIEKWAAERNSSIVALATRRAPEFYSAIGYSESATYFRKVQPGAQQGVAGDSLIYQMDVVFAIKTKRLILRDLLEEDGPVLHQLRSDPVVTQYMQYIKSEMEAETRQWVRDTIVHNVRIPRLSHNLVIVRQATRQVIGWIGIGQPSDPTWGDLDFGYALLPDYWGQGIMSEALEGLLGYAFEHLDAQRIFGECEAANKASARVMEKVGLHLEARQSKLLGTTDELSEILRYAIDREEWHSSQTG